MSLDYTEARFFLALASLAIASILTFMHILTGAQWLGADGSILTLYATHSLLDDKMRDADNNNNANRS